MNGTFSSSSCSDTVGGQVALAAVEDTSCEMLARASPLFEEKRHMAVRALISHFADPLGLHRPGMMTAFTSNDNPNGAASIRASVPNAW